MSKANMQKSFLSLRSHRRFVILICTIIQVPFIHYGLKLFSCTPIDEIGGTVLSLDPRVSCQHPSYLLTASLTSAILPIFILGPPLFTLKTLLETFWSKVSYTTSSSDSWGVFYEHYKTGFATLWEPARSLRRTAMAAVISVDKSVLGAGEEGGRRRRRRSDRGDRGAQRVGELAGRGACG